MTHKQVIAMQLINARFYSYVVPGILRGGLKLYEKEGFLLMSNTGCIKILDKKGLKWRDFVLD